MAYKDFNETPLYISLLSNKKFYLDKKNLVDMNRNPKTDCALAGKKIYSIHEMGMDWIQAPTLFH